MISAVMSSPAKSFSALRLICPVSPSTGSVLNTRPWVAQMDSVTSRYSGCTVLGSNTVRDLLLRLPRTAISTASASAVAPSYSEALLTSMPLRPHSMVWYS